MRTIHFHFDFLSPYAYYARHRLVQLAARHDAAIAYHPGDLKRLKLAAGNTGPATVQMPRRLAYALRDFERWAGRYGIPAATEPACFDVRDLNVGTYYAIAQGRAEHYVEHGFAQVWARRGPRRSPEAIVRDVAQAAGLDAGALLDFAASEEAAQAYDASFEAATAAGVFGVPTVRIDGELWWGNDRLFMVDDYLSLPLGTAASR